MNNQISDGLIVFMFIARIIGILEWATVFLLLMEVVICKDARVANTSRILNTKLSVRFRMFKRSIKNLFYRGSLIIFISSLFAVINMISDLWLGHFPRPPYAWTLVSLILPIGIVLIYVFLGYQLTFFKKFMLFIADLHD